MTNTTNIRSTLTKILLTLLIFTQVPISSNSLFAEKTTKNEFDLKKNMLAARITIGLAILELCYLTGNQATKDILKSQLESKTLLKNLMLNYSQAYFALFSHEFGHAIAGKLLTNSDVVMFLGKGRSECLGTFTKQPLSLVGFDPGAGFSVLKLSENPIENFIISAAGPLTGALSSITTQIALNKITNPIDSPNLTATDLLWNNTLTRSHLFQLLPHNGDGKSLFRIMGFSENIIKILGVISSFAELGAFYHKIDKNIQPETNHRILSKFLLACTNVSLVGLLEFHL